MSLPLASNPRKKRRKLSLSIRRGRNPKSSKRRRTSSRRKGSKRRVTRSYKAFVRKHRRMLKGHPKSGMRKIGVMWRKMKKRIGMK